MYRPGRLIPPSGLNWNQCPPQLQPGHTPKQSPPHATRSRAGIFSPSTPQPSPHSGPGSSPPPTKSISHSRPRSPWPSRSGPSTQPTVSWTPARSTPNLTSSKTSNPATTFTTATAPSSSPESSSPPSPSPCFSRALEPAAIRLYLILGVLRLRILRPHPRHHEVAHRLPKEIAVGICFAAATFIPTVARHPELRLALLPSALLFGALCSLNCLYIYAWEHTHHRRDTPSTPSPVSHSDHLSLLTTILAASSAALALFDHQSPWPISCAIATRRNLPTPPPPPPSHSRSRHPPSRSRPRPNHPNPPTPIPPPMSQAEANFDLIAKPYRWLEYLTFGRHPTENPPPLSPRAPQLPQRPDPRRRRRPLPRRNSSQPTQTSPSTP